MTFRVGQKVVCIAEGHGPILLGEVMSGMFKGFHRTIIAR